MLKLKKVIKSNWGIILIITLAWIIYFLNLSKVPNGFYADEASIAFNSFQISEYGIDEHGKSFPIYFEAFGEYKNPIYIYLLSFLYFLFGSSIFLIRSLSATLGVLNIFLIYLVGSEIKTKKAGIFSAAILTFMPWHFEIQRIGFEVASSGTLFLLSILLLLKWIKNKEKSFFLYLGGAITGLFLYSYSTAKLLSPLLILTFSLINLKSIFSKKYFSKFFIFYTIYCASLLPFLYYYFSIPNFNSRFNDFSIFQSENPLKTFIKNIYSHLSLDFLLNSGDSNPRHHIKPFQIGQLLWTTAFGFILSISEICKKRLSKNKTAISLGALIFLTLIPSSLTTQNVPHALRSYHLIFPLSLLLGYGLSKIKNKFIIQSLFLLMFMEFSIFLNQYLTVYPAKVNYGADGWQKEEIELNNFLYQNIKNYNAVYESNSYRLEKDIFHKWFLREKKDELKKIKPLSDLKNENNALVIKTNIDNINQSINLKKIKTLKVQSDYFIEVYETTN